MQNTKTIQGKEWKRKIKISEDTYQLISQAILKALTSEPIQFRKLLEKVENHITNFPGSVGWYTVGILRQLEKEGKIIRTKGKLVTYHKA